MKIPTFVIIVTKLVAISLHVSGLIISDQNVVDFVLYCYMPKLEIFSTHFYSASALLAMQSAVLAREILSVCLSVRLSVLPSRSGIVSRRMKIRSCGFQHLLGQSL